MFLADLPKLANTFGIHMFEKWTHWASVVCEKYHFCRIWSLIYVKVHIFWEGHKICEIFPLLLTAVHTVKIKRKILPNFVVFSEYMNFTLSFLPQRHLYYCIFSIHDFLLLSMKYYISKTSLVSWFWVASDRFPFAPF